MSIKELLLDCAPSHRKLAEELGISPAALSQLLNHGALPKKRWPEIRAAMLSLAVARGKAESDMEAALKELEQQPVSAPEETAEQEEDPMILRKQTLTMQARQIFGLVRNPFADPETSSEIYLNGESRTIRQVLYEQARTGGFMALIGESGSGKTTLKEELITRAQEDQLPIIFIEPYTLAMSESDRMGKPLVAAHIEDAILSTVAPGERIPVRPELRRRRMHEILKASSMAGMRHCLIIEEAHDLHRQTLKSLKRFHELKNGMTRLLSIILLGQTELEKKFSVTDTSTREVVQRCEVYHLPAISDPGDFLRYRFEHAGLNFKAIFTPDAVDAIRESLTVSPDSRGDGIYMGYPLMIANLATAALNLAASVGEKQVTADVVRMVRQ